MAATRDWGGELEAQQNLLTKQQHQLDAQRSQISTLQKKLGVSTPEEEADVPAAEYRRVFLATAAFLLWDSASMSIAAFTSGMEGDLGQVETL